VPVFICNRSSTSSFVRPCISILFSREALPPTTLISRLAKPRRSAKYSTKALFASPSTGGAVNERRIRPFSSNDNALRLAFGCTRIISRALFFAVMAKTMSEKHVLFTSLIIHTFHPCVNLKNLLLSRQAIKRRFKKKLAAPARQIPSMLSPNPILRRKNFVVVFRITFHVPILAIDFYYIAELEFDFLEWLVAQRTTMHDQSPSFPENSPLAGKRLQHKRGGLYHIPHQMSRKIFQQKFPMRWIQSLR